MLKLQITIGEKYGPAMHIVDQAQADAYFEALVLYNMRVSGCIDQRQAEEVERCNLGYFAGYHSAEVREWVERLFRCAHPIFGKIATNRNPSLLQAFQAGVRSAEQAQAIIPAQPVKKKDEWQYSGTHPMDQWREEWQERLKTK